ncbi:MAG TPA: VOC family protein [Thermoanaerobaculia bacterium]|jgi:catechol 2,3-dioxygenase-like lactoylglutathione lyase family enzyme|nr:VOC family protein [Thermoanaerobaculia bacterium]
MEIRQFRVVIRAKSFDRTCRFYGESLALPRLQNWDREDGRGALFQAGSGIVEVQGRPAGQDRGFDETFEYQGPQHKMSLVMTVLSAEQAYAECHFRDKNIPGGLRKDEEGNLLFETHDPDGVRILFLQKEG